MRYNHFSMLPEMAFRRRFGSSAPSTLEGGEGEGPLAEVVSGPGFSYDPNKFTPQQNVQADTNRGAAFPVYTPDYTKYDYAQNEGVPSLNYSFNYGDADLNSQAGLLSLLGAAISGNNTPSGMQGDAQSGPAGVAGLAADK